MRRPSPAEERENKRDFKKLVEENNMIEEKTNEEVEKIWIDFCKYDSINYLDYTGISIKKAIKFTIESIKDDFNKNIEELQEKIRLSPNRDDQIEAKLVLLDGGGINKFFVRDELEKLKR